MPRTFRQTSSKETEWDELSFRFRAYVSLTDTRAIIALEVAEKAPTIVTEAHFVTMDDEERDVDLRLLARRVFHQFYLNLQQGLPV